MVGIVIVTHSNKLAEGLLHELRMFSKTCPIAIAGGDDDGGYGTSYNKITDAINSVYSDDGVCVLTDIGSSTMTSEFVIEELSKDNIKLLECPLLEGAITATVSSEQGKTLKEIIDSIPKIVEPSN